jgi:hypothetical protein
MKPNSASFPSRREPLVRTGRRAQSRLARATRAESRFAFTRFALTLALIAALAGIYGTLTSDLKVILIALFLAISVAFSTIHVRFRNRVERWQGLVASYAHSLLRLDRNFDEIRSKAAPWSAPIGRAIPPGHPYASDLDLGTSLFPLLDTCATAEGSHALFDELIHAGTNPLSPSERTLRSERASTLASRTKLLREHESLRTNPHALAEYLRQRDMQQGDLKTRIMAETTSSRAAVFLVTSVVAIATWVVFLLPALVRYLDTQNSEALFHAVISYAIFPMAAAFLFKPLVDIAGELSRRLKFLGLIVSFVEQAGRSPHFAQFSCVTGGARRELRWMSWLLDALSARNNPILWLLLHAFLPFDAMVCALLWFRVRAIAPQLANWERDITEFDLICAIARFASENPDCRFFTDSTTQHHRFTAEGLGHPLLPATTRVCNNFALSESQPMVLLTGSNMSGKSTFLRTIGVNILMHNMGAPVCAVSFVTPPRRLLCAIRVDDSMADGTSYFYAEVKRLKTILQTLAEGRERGEETLFLVDEIFRGTNNRERFIGSWHILHALIGSGGLGLVSTHDLALTELDRRDSRLRNLHFREHVVDDKLVFDYEIKEGPCPTTNALAIMRAEGLPIPDEASLQTL